MAKRLGTLFLVTEETDNVYADLASQSDRGLGVLGGALVDDALTRALRHSWRDDPKELVEKQAVHNWIVQHLAPQHLIQQSS